VSARRKEGSGTKATAMRIAEVGAVALCALLVTASPASAQFAGYPSLASVNSAGDQANSDAWHVAISADGTIVAFASDADNLVPLDNNGDTDVFVHDSVTGVTTRVSVNYQGEEVQGDSACPSLSADARYVAFLSRAPNMVQGGENFSVWEVYLRDRQGPQTIRVSVPLDGGPNTRDSLCPVISADGQRVAFASPATGLVADDTNDATDVFVYDVPSGSLVRASLADDEAQADGASDSPAISADGTVVVFASSAGNLTPESPSEWQRRPQVYARDLDGGTTEMISRAFSAPVQIPNGHSCCPEIAADGSVVIFRSVASNLTADLSGNRPLRLFLHDRTTGVTEGVEPMSLGPGPCGWLTDPLVCDANATTAAALSADGRFVAFLNSSVRLLPGNARARNFQAYLQDRQTRRLRRVTVDPTGYPINAYPCGAASNSLSLSEDGRVLGLVGEQTAAFGLPQANRIGVRDVVRLEWTCDQNGGPCRELSLCPGAPASTCEPAKDSRLRILRNPPLSVRRERFDWRWVGPRRGEGEAFVDPADGRYHLCVYTGETMNAQIDAGIPTSAPWRRVRSGWRLRDKGGAVEHVRLRSSAVRTVVRVMSTSASLDLPYLPLDAPQGVTVQLHESTTGRCWEAAFDASALRINSGGAITPGRVTPGFVRADLD